MTITYGSTGAATPAIPRDRLVRYVTEALDEVIIHCAGQLVARHHRSWAPQGIVTDPLRRHCRPTA